MIKRRGPSYIYERELRDDAFIIVCRLRFIPAISSYHFAHPFAFMLLVLLSRLHLISTRSESFLERTSDPEYDDKTSTHLYSINCISVCNSIDLSLSLSLARFPNINTRGQKNVLLSIIKWTRVKKVASSSVSYYSTILLFDSFNIKSLFVIA